MAINAFTFALLLGALSPLVLASTCESQVERAAKRMFYDSNKTDNGQLDGLVLGSGKAKVVAYLESRGVSKIRVVHEKYFYATHDCMSELEKVDQNGLIYVSGRNNRIVGKIRLAGGRVSKVDLVKGFSAAITQGMPRDEFIRALRNVLAADRRVSIYPVPNCLRQCIFNLRDTLDVGSAASANAWEFVFPGGEKRYTVHFVDEVLTMASYERQRFAGNGVF